MTNSQEEYLKIIYIINTTKNKVRVTDIADKLNVKKPSVNKAIKNLSDMGYINYEAYGDISFTNIGESKAKDIIRKYDIVKLFLVEILNVEEEIAEEEVKTIKYAISKETEKKLENHVSKLLKLGDLDCGYDETKEKCRNCIKANLIKNKKTK